MIEVTLTGTGSPLPDPNRAGPSTLVRAGGTAFLVDAGRGALMRTAAVGVQANALTAVLLTHLHSDHITDLNDVITTRWVTTFTPSPLRVIGPPGTADVVDGLLRALAPDVNYRIRHHDDLDGPPQVEVTETTDGVVHDADGVLVRVSPTDHRPVEPSIAYRFEQAGRVVVIAGDTAPCAALDELLVDAEALVITAIRKDVLGASGIRRFEDVCDYHSSVEEAAQMAKRAGVRTLVLTHYVPALTPETIGEWRTLADAHFDGELVLGDDLTAIRLEPR